MAEAVSYPLKDTPEDEDNLLAISDPNGAWGIRRVTVANLLAEVRARLSALELALKNASLYPGEMVFTITGDTFAPAITLDDPEGTAEVEWVFSEDAASVDVSTPTSPVVTFHTAAERHVRLKVTPWSALRRLNLGYYQEDGGSTAFEIVDAANVQVSHIANLSLAAPYLREFMACRNPISVLDFTDFTALEVVEMFNTPSLVAVHLRNTANLRRLCVEHTSVTFLDFSTSPLMEDLRGSYTNVTEIRWGESGGQHLWHHCTHHNGATLVVPYRLDNLPVLEELWIWENGEVLTGHLSLSTTVLTSARCYGNDFTSADFTGNISPEGGHIWIQNNPRLASLRVGSNPGLDELLAQNCALSSAAVDQVLADLVANGNSGGSVNLSNNSPPTGTGMSHIETLEGRGWTCIYDEPVPPALESVTIGEDGLSWMLVFSEPVRIGSGGAGGLAVEMENAGVVELTYASGDGTDTLVFTGSVEVLAGDTSVSGLSYTQPGDGIESSQGLDVESFANAVVVNNSVQGPLALLSATVGQDGTTWTLVFNRAVQLGAAGGGGFVAQMATAGTVNLTYQSGAGTNTLVFSGDVEVAQGDTGTLSYTQPTDGIEDAADGEDLASFTNAQVTNNSEQEGSVNYLTFVDIDPTPRLLFAYNIDPAQVTVTWHWSDGTTEQTIGTADPVKNFGSVGGPERRHWVEFSHPEAVTRIDTRRDDTVLSIEGANNLPNVDFIYAYQSAGLAYLDVSNMPNLQQVHIASCAFPVEVGDQICIDLDASAPDRSGQGTDLDLYINANQVSEASAAARASLQAKGWTISLISE